MEPKPCVGYKNNNSSKRKHAGVSSCFVVNQVYPYAFVTNNTQMCKGPTFLLSDIIKWVYLRENTNCIFYNILLFISRSMTAGYKHTHHCCTSNEL